MSELSHIPVLLSQIIEVLSPPILAAKDPIYFDGTFGRGGHLAALLQQFPQLRAFAADRDADAIQFGEQHFAEEIKTRRLRLQHANFADFSVREWGLFDAMLVDLGVSSPQLDQGPRGFSFYHEGPLDMRMDTRQETTAADLIATLSEDELIHLFQEYGEISKPYRVVRALVHDRKSEPFTTTHQLASLIERVDGWRRKGSHPATQYFLALRLQVNQELAAVETGLPALLLGLKPRGRLAVLTFHSLEDRIVKNLFKERSDLGTPVFKKVITAEWTEQKKNPRARSAKLRVFERSEDGQP